MPIYQRLMNNQDPEKFIMPLGKPILDNIHHISVNPHDLQMPELVSSFCAWVLDRPRASFLSQFQHGFFTCPKQLVMNALRQSIVPHLATLAPSQAQELISDIFETSNFSLLLRRACLIGQYDIIKTLLSFQLLLSIDINEPSKKGYTALDYLEKHTASATKNDMIALLHCHGAHSHTEILRAPELK